MLIAWQNLSDEAAATLTADTTAALLPVANLRVVTFDSVCRFEAASGWIAWDLGSSLTLRAIFLGGTNLTSAATKRIRLSDVSTTGTDILDTGTVTASVNDDYRSLYHVLAADTAARYGRIDLADSSLTFIDVARLFVGPAWIPTYGPQLEDAIVPVDLGRKQQTAGGQVFTDFGPQGRLLDFTLDVGEAEAMASARALDRAVGTTRDVLAMIETSGSYVSENAVFGQLDVVAPLTTRAFNLRRKRYVVRERINPYLT